MTPPFHFCISNNTHIQIKISAVFHSIPFSLRYELPHFQTQASYIHILSKVCPRKTYHKRKRVSNVRTILKVHWQDSRRCISLVTAPSLFSPFHFHFPFRPVHLPVEHPLSYLNLTACSVPQAVPSFLPARLLSGKV